MKGCSKLHIIYIVATKKRGTAGAQSTIAFFTNHAGQKNFGISSLKKKKERKERAKTGKTCHILAYFVCMTV